MQAKNDIIWQYKLNDFSQASYSQGVKASFEACEQSLGRKITPGPKARVGLKIFTWSGPGICTPIPLVKAVIQELESRGYQKKDIFLIDQRGVQLRRCKFIPLLSQGGYDFEGYPVYALDRSLYWDPLWFYESELPSKESPVLRTMRYGSYSENDPQGRKSYLPVPLLQNVDFWINLPMVMSHKAFGVSGAVANASLHLLSNNSRFFDNPHHAAVALAEVPAIPELRETYAFTILTLERYQVIGGFFFNANYSYSEPYLLTSTNLVALDYLMLGKINQGRKKHRLPTIDSTPLFFDYCEQLKLGKYLQSDVQVLKLEN